MMPETAPATVHIASFRRLPDTAVSEHWKFTHNELLSWLELKPTARWNGQHDTPGWSPVLYDPPARAKDNIKYVYALVLDYDKEKPTVAAVVALWRSFLGLVYTTKSHDIDNNRLRAVLPLSRPITPEEYDRLWIWAERQGKNAGLKTDGQAKDASRFWYVPTQPERGEWRAERLTGSVLDVDATLPLAEQPTLTVVRAPMPDTQDQRVERARRYLEKIPGAVSGDAGHTRTFNAVAHVMIGFDLDPDTTLSIIASDYNPRCDPPWKEKDLLHKIRSVAERCTRERGYLLQQDRRPVETTRQAAASAPAVPDELEVNWRELIIYGDKKKPKRGYHNVLAFVRHHDDYRGRWSLNTMTGSTYFDEEPMPDTFVHDIRANIDRQMGFSPGREDVEAAILTSAQDRKFHPIQQYLRSVDWDGTERLSSIARDILGTDNPLHAQMARRWIISAVARALQPGCKVDTALMLYGPQGYFKSSFFAILGGDWHADSPIDIQNKDSFAQIHAAWIYEFAELENVVHGRAESRLKAWVTSTHDMFRAPYARVVERKARSCVICGTTNRKQFLTDDTGNRRYWIIPVAAPIDRDELTHMRDQLWAEAVAAYEAGETWWLDREQELERERLSTDFLHSDPWQDAVESFLDNPLLTEVTISDLLSGPIKLDIARQDQTAQTRVARILARAGWSQVRSRDSDAGRRKNVYRRSG